jgi:hypothetical protein
LGPAARRREDHKVIPLFQVLFLSFSSSLFTVLSLGSPVEKGNKIIRKKEEKERRRRKRRKEKDI